MTKITHRRAGRGNNGSHWIGYSDMMASLLLVFVLTLCYSMYLYFSTLETKTAELEEQRAVVAEQQSTLDEQTVRLEAQAAQLAQQQEDLESAQASLAEQQAALDAANETLASREEELASLQSQLAQQQITLDAQAEVLASQQEALESQTAKIDDLVGVRTQIVSELSSALTASGLKATVDPNSGDITLDSAVFFETASYTIKADGASHA